MSKINREVRLRALEIRDEVIEAAELAGSEGMKFSEGAELVGMEYDEFYSAVHELSQMGGIKVSRGPVGNQNRILHPEWPEISPVLSGGQKSVLKTLEGRMDGGGYARISQSEIGDLSGCKSSYFIVERLDYKGFLEIVERGDPCTAALYKVYPQGDGPLGYSSMSTDRGGATFWAKQLKEQLDADAM